MILTIAIVNLRHALYSISIAPHLFRLPRFWKAVLAYLLTDEAYAMAIQNYENERKNHKHWFFLGAGLALWTTWQVSTAAGILLGAVVPSEWSLDFALPLTFIAIVIPSLKDRAAVAVALTSGVLAVAVYHFPYKLGLMVAAFSGILVGLLIEVEK
jgi:predicted branched-subunit amino acid permease